MRAIRFERLALAALLAGMLAAAGCSSGSDGAGDVAAAPTSDGGGGGGDAPADPGPTPGAPGGGTPPPAQSTDLFVDIPSPDEVTITLHPGRTVVPGEPVLAGFGVPFPRATIDDAAGIRIVDESGNEMPSHVEELARWRTLGADASTDSLRAALVYVEVVFSDASPVAVGLEYGTTRSLSLAPPAGVRETWVPIAGEIDPDEYAAAEGIREPAVYATLPPDWLGKSLLRTRNDVAFQKPEWSDFDTAFVNYAHTAVNDVSDLVTEDRLIDYENRPAPWLFDRAQVLFGVYFRTGDVKWLRHAHRAAQFYANHLDAAGAFDLKSFPDLKYSYGHSLLTDLLLTGDRSHVETIERIAGFAGEWPDRYRHSANFWTERHLAYAILGRLAAWEATGKPEHRDRVAAIVRETFDSALNPALDWPAIGCILHTMEQHEGDPDQRPVCSPWMSALLGDAVWRYYLQSEDPAALEFIAGLGNFLAEHGVYEADADSGLEGRVMPFYLSSHEVREQGDSWANMEHACDAAGLGARALWAKRALGEADPALARTVEDLIDTCEFTLDHWHREGSDASIGAPQWRLSPPRKFNWWFGTTTDLSWLLAE